MHVVTCHTINAHQVTKHPSIAGTKHTKKIRYRSADQSDSNFHHYLGVSDASRPYQPDRILYCIVRATSGLNIRRF
jgi:hypothetical protein